MRELLLGASCGWVGSSIYFIITGGFNLGTVFTGMVVGLCWMIYLAYSRRSV